MYKIAYKEKLKHPKWQKFRLEIFERDGWECCACGNKEDQLHLHHLVYSEGDPWEAPKETMETLCEPCHVMRELFDGCSGEKSIIPTKFIWMFMRFVQCIQEQKKQLTTKQLVSIFSDHCWKSFSEIHKAIDELGTSSN